jgi:ABC-2 type transport system permease protein
MFSRILRFELGYQLRRPFVYICFAAFVLFGFVAIAVSSLHWGSNDVYRNSPFTTATILSILNLMGTFVPLAMLARLAMRDSATRMDQLMRAAPVGAASYIIGRFCGTFLAASFIYAGAVVGLMLGSIAPWIDPAFIGPFRIAGYTQAFLVFSIPNVFFFGAVFFTIATATRSMFATYISAIAFLALYFWSLSLMRDPSYLALFGAVDPLGVGPLGVVTRYWTVFERNTNLIPVVGTVLWNRLAWTAFGAAMLALAVLLYRRTDTAGHSLGRASPPAPMSVAAARQRVRYGGAGSRSQLAARIRFETRAMLGSWLFPILLVLGALISVGALMNLGTIYGTPNLPVTRVIVQIVAGAFGLSSLIIAGLFSAELVWRERQTRIAPIIDATPTSNAVFLVAKLVAITLVMGAVFVVAMLTGIGFQLAKGFTQIDFDFYIVMLFVLIGLPMVMWAVLAVFIQALVNNKYLGLLVTLMLLVAISCAGLLGVEDKLLVFAELVTVPLSDMNRFGHFLDANVWLLLYWGFVCVLLGVATHLLWVRGIASSFFERLRGINGGMTRPVAAVAIVAVLGAAGTGGFVYWNTHVLNDYATKSDSELEQVDYEKAYARFGSLPQPRVTEVEVAADLYPQARRFVSRGHMTLTNRTDAAIETVHVQFSPTVDVDKVELADADLVESSIRFHHYVFRPRTPLAPGGARIVTFALSQEHPGFTNDADTSSILNNGSFIHSPELTPSIGVSKEYYLSDAAKRRAHGLDPLMTIAPLDNKEQRHRNYISADADFIRFAATLSTSPDQIAVAPGYLQREWLADGRRFFRYEMDKPILNFWTVVSARYEIARDSWNGVDLAVYYHPGHDTNVPRMLESMKQSLAYYSEKFGPYQHRQMRILEFPNYITLAQSFPNTVPYSEGLGFIADNRDPAKTDYVWYVIAHEVAHQWWAHQVIGANVQGATLLSETLAQYSALMVMEHRYGADQMRKFLKYELDEYLSTRGRTGDELPLNRVKPNQGYIHYQKGSVAMYALKDAIGEAAVNRALAHFLRQQGLKWDPYPASTDLIAALRKEAGPKHQQLVTDLFEKIVLWDLDVVASEATPTGDGKWRIRIDVKAGKVEADSEGRETAKPLDQFIDIGLFAVDPSSSGFSKDDVIKIEKRRLTTGAQSIEFIVERKPAFVGVDPYVKLIERNTAKTVVPLGGQQSSTPRQS